MRLPDVVNVIEQVPAATAAEQLSPVFALTVTVPVGAVTFVDPTTLKLISAGLFGSTGFGEIAVIVVVVVA